jgi:hypothetical protein
MITGPLILAHGVRLYFRFGLSYREVEELIFARWVIVSYESIRQWFAGRSGKRMAINSVGFAHSQGKHGLWMKSFSRLTANGTTCGGLWIIMGMFLIFLCSLDAIRE